MPKPLTHFKYKDTTKTPNTNNMNTISLRLYPETEKLYKQLLDECDAGTNGRPATADQFINYLLECAQNPRTKEVSKPSDLQRIQELETQNETLKAKVTELESVSFRDQSELTILRNKLEAQPAADQEPAPAALQLAYDQIIITLFDTQVQSIQQYKQQLLAKQGKEYTNGEIFAAMLNRKLIDKLPVK